MLRTHRPGCFSRGPVNLLCVRPCHVPVIMSGGDASDAGSQAYDLSPRAVSDTRELTHRDPVLLQCGVAYRGRCVHVSRTFFISPAWHHERAYALLMDAHATCLAALRPGAALTAVEAAVQQQVASSSWPQTRAHLSISLLVGV